MNESVLSAKKSHQVIRNELTEMSNIIKEKNPNFSTDILLKQFSLMMQAIMLRQIVADGVITHEERLFIREVCDRYDLLQICKISDTFSFKGIDWEHLEKIDSKTAKLLCEEINIIVYPLEDEMTFYLALVDANTKKHYYQIFFKEMANIFSRLNYIDDELDESEQNEVVSAFLDHFVTRYKYFYNLLRKGK